MHPLAIGLVLGSAVIHALREMVTKRAYDKQIFIWLFCVVSIPLFFPLFLYEAWLGNVTLMTVLLSAGASVVHACYWYTMSRAYEGGDLSHVYPIMRSAPALIFVLSVIFLHERVSGPATVGVAIILAGIYMINMKRISLQGFLEPLESFRERHTRFALLTALTVTAYSIQDKVMVGRVALRQVSIVFGVLLGGHLLKERHKWIRLSAAGLILAGTVCSRLWIIG